MGGGKGGGGGGAGGQLSGGAGGGGLVDSVQRWQWGHGAKGSERSISTRGHAVIGQQPALTRTALSGGTFTPGLITWSIFSQQLGLSSVN